MLDKATFRCVEKLSRWLERDLPLMELRDHFFLRLPFIDHKLCCFRLEIYMVNCFRLLAVDLLLQRCLLNDLSTLFCTGYRQAYIFTVAILLQHGWLLKHELARLG